MASTGSTIEAAPSLLSSTSSNGLPSSSAPSLAGRTLELYHHSREYEARFARQAKENEQLRQIVQSQHQEVEIHRHALAQENEVRQALNAEISARQRAEEQLRSHQEDVSKLNEAMTSKGRDAVFWEGKAMILREEKRQSQEEMTRQSTELEQVRIRCREAEDNLATAQSRASEVEGRLQTCTTRDGEQAALIKDLEGKLADKNLAVFRLRSDVEEAEEAKQKLKKDKDEAARLQMQSAERLKWLNATYSACQASLQQEKNLHDKARTELTAAQKTIEQLQTRKAADEGSLQASIEALRSQLTATTLQQKAETPAAITDIKLKWQQCTKENTELHANFMETTRSLQEAEVKVRELQKELIIYKERCLAYSERGRANTTPSKSNTTSLVRQSPAGPTNGNENFRKRRISSDHPVGRTEQSPKAQRRRIGP